METEINDAVKNPQDLIDHLTYASYKHNRNISPHITPEQWGTIFHNVEQLEKKYQQELISK